MYPNLSFHRMVDAETGRLPHNIGWNLVPEELQYVPEHWLMFPEPDKSIQILLGMMYVVVFVAGFIGNGLVLWIFSSAKSLRTASNMFVVNLALCDFVMMASIPILIYNSFMNGFASGFLGCQLIAVLGGISGIGSSVTNACIAYDRYSTITRPFDGKINKVKAALMLCCIWSYVIPLNVLPLFDIWGRYVAEGYLTTCSFDYFDRSFNNKLFVTMLFTFAYVLPISMTIFFYSQIVRKIFSHEKALREQAKKMNVESLRANQNQHNESAEVRIAKAAITVCVLYLTSWTPYAAIALTGIYGDQSLLTPGLSMIPAVSAKLVASCCDPYVYAISHPKYRIELQKRLPWLAIKEKDETVSDTTSVATAATT